ATRDNVVSLRIALADGSVIETAPQTLNASGAPPADLQARLAAAAGRIARSHRALVEDRLPTTRRNSSGYALRHLLAGPVDLPKPLVGSEGPLGLILEATLRVLPIPKAKATALVLFDDLPRAGAGVVEILKAAPSAVELLDRTFVEVIREADPGTSASLP